MAVEPPVGAALLACGRDAATVWDRASDGQPPDEHERTCPHCGAARADAGGLGALVTRMAAEPVEPPDGVVDRVVAAVRSELRPHDLLRLDSPEGPAFLSVVAAAGVLRGVVDRMDGMRARSCRIVQSPTATDIDVTVTVTARFGVDMASVAARVRQMVLVAGEAALGLPVRRVDIEIVDVYEAAAAGVMQSEAAAGAVGSEAAAGAVGSEAAAGAVGTEAAAGAVGTEAAAGAVGTEAAAGAVGTEAAAGAVGTEAAAGVVGTDEQVRES